MDNRLDFINEFKNKKRALEEMTVAREAFIEMDNVLRNILTSVKGTSNYSHALIRAVSHARSSLEVTLQYTIKALCLKHEAK